MTQKADLLGQTFGRLRVVEAAPSDPKNGKALWRCACECGGEAVTGTHRLRTGRTRSCGCLVREGIGERRLKHGGSANRTRTKEYRAWVGIRRRTLDPKHPAFQKYGAVGLGIGPEWVNDFLAFLAEIGPAPSEKHTVDRINNHRGYEPGNVRWATKREQARNQRRNIYVVINGERMLLIDACKLTGVDYFTAYQRLRRGRPPFPV